MTQTDKSDKSTRAAEQPEVGVGAEVWQPKQEDLADMTLEERVELLNKVIELGSSDSQFAKKMKESIAYILLSTPLPTPGKPHETASAKK